MTDKQKPLSELVRRGVFEGIWYSIIEGDENHILGKLADEIAKLESTIKELQGQVSAQNTVMAVAAAEIEEFWEAHCDEDGLGPTNLVRRLKDGGKKDCYPCYCRSMQHFLDPTFSGL